MSSLLKTACQSLITLHHHRIFHEVFLTLFLFLVAFLFTTDWLHVSLIWAHAPVFEWKKERKQNKTLFADHFGSKTDTRELTSMRLKINQLQKETKPVMNENKWIKRLNPRFNNISWQGIYKHIFDQNHNKREKKKNPQKSTKAIKHFWEVFIPCQSKSLEILVQVYNINQPFQRKEILSGSKRRKQNTRVE